MEYARLSPDLQSIERVIDLTPTYVAALAPSKQAMLRPYVVDPQPAITGAQVVSLGPLIIDGASVRQTWAVRDKTADELEGEALEGERAQVADVIAKLQVAVDQWQALLDVPYSEPTAAGTTAAEVAALRARIKAVEQAQRALARDLVSALRAERFLLRRVKRGL